MNKNRVNEFKKPFEGKGPDSTTLYTNQEIVDLLQEILSQMKLGIYEKVHSEYMRDKDVMLHISNLASEYGLKETETYKRFEKNMNELGYTIGSYIKGMQGERIARRTLKFMSFDKNVKILYNIALEDEEVQAEYDAIIITPYGMFVVEVKNWGVEMHIDENGILKRNDQEIKYDLPGRMSIKEGLLREYLGELFPENYQGIMLFPNENAKLQDDYRQMPICYGGGIVYKIRAFNKGTELLTASQINEVAEIINSNHKEQKTLCRVNCEEIIEDYAVLMTAIEEVAEGTYSSMEDTVYIEAKEEKEVQENISQDITNVKYLTKALENKKFNVKNWASGAAGLLAAFGFGIAVAKSVLPRR